MKRQKKERGKQKKVQVVKQSGKGEKSESAEKEGPVSWQIKRWSSE